MIGAIAGDVIGSVHEWRGTKTKRFRLFVDGSTFTDDTVLTVAVADALTHDTGYVDAFHEYFQHYPLAGFGGTFRRWAASRSREPYQSWGNGSAMRVSPVAYAHDDLESVLEAAKASAEVTHDHPEGIKGAQAVAGSIFLARKGEGKAGIREFVERRIGYDLGRSLREIRRGYVFDVSCQGSVPEAIIAFLESDSFEDAVRNAISLGGDSDTQACIAGAIAEPFHGGVPEEIRREVWDRLDRRLQSAILKFRRKFSIDGPLADGLPS